jgi:hypothetical protein
MPSTEQSIKAEYAKIFVASDWQLFKRMAEAQFREAAFLRKKDMHVNQVLKLLARNSRKRLLIGIGTELLLKAVYLRNGYCINKPESKSSIAFPFTQQDASRAATSLVAAETVMLGEMIDHLLQVVKLPDAPTVLKGLKVAKVFRNKERHVVTQTQKFNASDYRQIEASLVHLSEHDATDESVGYFHSPASRASYFVFHREGHAALPPHIAESLWLSV